MSQVSVAPDGNARRGSTHVNAAQAARLARSSVHACTGRETFQSQRTDEDVNLIGAPHETVNTYLHSRIALSVME
jgi:hypothetical protein